MTFVGNHFEYLFSRWFSELFVGEGRNRSVPIVIDSKATAVDYQNSIELCTRLNCSQLYSFTRVLLWFYYKNFFPGFPLNCVHIFFWRSFLFVKFFSMQDLFNERLLEMCSCLHTRHISISPRFNHYENPSIKSCIYTNAAIDNGNGFSLSFSVSVYTFCRFI